LPIALQLRVADALLLACRLQRGDALLVGGFQLVAGRLRGDPQFVVVRVVGHDCPNRSCSSASSVSSGTRSCFIVSRSRIVTALSSRVSKSMVTHNGVPTSSWRR